ncbi:acyl-CoA oxidase [Pseudovirgaria hyperparasitica]|uniref:Acyl-coenzyme A oxidase n=1 Tax=Pseudovirgaria hyperparasitica TaxID=470096 RepID=A0A6A6W6Y8_9PEZI|nr:acyl-CoA oxidase [Pseudovirgaria hyperparasitica]KAF2758648.1 acyl-CoA oxidase [Pseudovirgaria hyperparasitica]
MPDFTDNLKPLYDGAAILEHERSRSLVNIDELSRHLLSRNGFLERQARVLAIIEREQLFSKKQQLNLSRPERYHLGLARAKALRRLTRKHGWDFEDYRMAEYLTDEMSPYFLHMSMFATTVREQASDDQKRYWMPKIEAWEMIGAYAQTELGHGSNVRGLETTATYDVVKKEFVIHSPTLTASKWWNGSMGRTATHAIVVAQLMLPKKGHISQFESYGPHPFIVRIRQEGTHLPPDGIVVGDIGAKYGYTSMDNGYMLFNNYRVSHSAMLARYSKVDQDTGTFSRTGNPAVVYGSLTNVRANIIMHARLILARAVTIAVRYTSVRRQFRDRDSKSTTEPETAVLDYPTVQIRLLPLLATAFALHYTGDSMYNLYNQTRSGIEKGDFTELAELHSTSSGLKALCTTYAADGIETCRRAMGGHGFGGGSGLININNDYLSKPTVEGDNWMITQQMSSHLIKKMTAAVKRPNAEPVDATDELFKRYLQQQKARKPADAVHWMSIDDNAIVDAFQWRAADLTYRAYQDRVERKKPWNSLLIQLHKLSKAFSESIVVTNFHASLRSNNIPSETSTVIRDLYRLYALHTMDTDARSFATTTAATDSTLDALSDAILKLMTSIRPHAVKLVDSWMMPDYLLDSALGRYDGKVYEALYDMAHRQNPLNRTVFNWDWRSEEIVLGSGDGGKLESKL